MRIFVLVVLIGVVEWGSAAPFDQPPKWAESAIWYQIFVERFRNGDPSNDPRPEWMEGAYPGYVPDGWQVTPWGHDWYEPEAWAEDGVEGLYRSLQSRRYGGDLQGVLDRLDYLHDLGVTALYFNPLNDSPSLHKYDARHYRHIDRTFGPDPVGDTKLIEAENPTDPATWQWTAADRLFLKVIEEVHRRGMRLIIDYSWNHTGNTFWAWQDVVKRQRKSRFSDWYDVTRFDDPNTPENEFAFPGWLGIKTLPELRKIHVREKREGYPYEGNLTDDVKAHVFNVTRRWLDPNGDGDPSDGVDGFRLDVAPDVPLGFWRDYRRFVRSIHPDALLLGEAWWTDWPDHLMDPRPFLQGDIFDSVMHYQWYKPARKFFAQANGGIKPSEFVAAMRRVYQSYSWSTQRSLMNLAAGHDSPRLATSFQNKQQYKFRMGARGNEDLDLSPPNETTMRRMRLLLLHQFSYVSAPHIWNGDEMGMWGADDPDCRQPLLWQDVEHQPKVFRPDGSRGESVQPKFDTRLWRYYQHLTGMRRERVEFLRGNLKFAESNDANMTLAYHRAYDGRISWVLFNLSDETQWVPTSLGEQDEMDTLIESIPGALIAIDKESYWRFQLAPLSGVAIGN